MGSRSGEFGVRGQPGANSTGGFENELTAVERVRAKFQLAAGRLQMGGRREGADDSSLRSPLPVPGRVGQGLERGARVLQSLLSRGNNYYSTG